MNIKEKKKNHIQISKEEEKQMFKELSGSQHQDLCASIIQSAQEAFPKSTSKGLALSISTQAMQEMAPQDLIEGMLCSQIISLNAQGMRYLARAESDGNLLCHTEAAVNMAIKLLRLKNETIEALTRYRRKGEQKVVVQHINVTDDARAIIGDLNDNRGGGNAKS